MSCHACALRNVPLRPPGEEGGRPRKRNPVKTLRRMDVVELDPAAFPGGVRIEVRVRVRAAAGRSHRTAVLHHYIMFLWTASVPAR